MRSSTLLLVAILLAGCGGPWGPLAGGRLAGTQASSPVRDWSFANEYPLMEIEVRPADPYSVKVHSYVVDGRLYVEAGENGWSRWRGMLHEDPRARVRFGETVYPVRAVPITEPSEIARVLPPFYAKDSDEPSPACRATWDAATCAFEGTFYRLESPPAAS